MTTLCVNLYQRTGIPTFYGMMLLHFGFNKGKHSFEQLSRVLGNPDSFRDDVEEMIRDAKSLRKGHLVGKLLGGNLAVLCWLLGTEFALTVNEDTILFLEDDEETNGYYWQMYLIHLKQAGIFEKVRGVIVGRIPPETKFEKGSSLEEIIEDVLGEYRFPIVVNASFGHVINPVNIPYGFHVNMSVS